MPDQKKRMKAGQEAGEEARAQTVRTLNDNDITVERISRKLGDALEANIIQTHFESSPSNHVEKEEKTESGWRYSDPLVDHRTRLAAIKIASTLLDINPTSRHEVNHANANFIIQSNIPEPEPLPDEPEKSEE